MLKGVLYSFRIYVSCEQSGMEVSLTGLISLYLISPYFTFIKHAVLPFIFYLVSNEKMARTERIALRDHYIMHNMLNGHL